jgi:hypothetical protein
MDLNTIFRKSNDIRLRNGRKLKKLRLGPAHLKCLLSHAIASDMRMVLSWSYTNGLSYQSYTNLITFIVLQYHL